MRKYNANVKVTEIIDRLTINWTVSKNSHNSATWVIICVSKILPLSSKSPWMLDKLEVLAGVTKRLRFLPWKLDTADDWDKNVDTQIYSEIL